MATTEDLDAIATALTEAEAQITTMEGGFSTSDVADLRTKTTALGTAIDDAIGRNPNILLLRDARLLTSGRQVLETAQNALEADTDGGALPDVDYAMQSLHALLWRLINSYGTVLNVNPQQYAGGTPKH